MMVSSGTWYRIRFTVSSSYSSILGGSRLGTTTMSPLLRTPRDWTGIVTELLGIRFLGCGSHLVSKPPTAPPRRRATHQNLIRMQRALPLAPLRRHARQRGVEAVEVPVLLAKVTRDNLARLVGRARLGAAVAEDRLAVPVPDPVAVAVLGRDAAAGVLGMREMNGRDGRRESQSEERWQRAGEGRLRRRGLTRSCSGPGARVCRRIRCSPQWRLVDESKTIYGQLSVRMTRREAGHDASGDMRAAAVCRREAGRTVLVDVFDLGRQLKRFRVLTVDPIDQFPEEATGRLRRGLLQRGARTASAQVQTPLCPPYSSSGPQLIPTPVKLKDWRLTVLALHSLQNHRSSVTSSISSGGSRHVKWNERRQPPSQHRKLPLPLHASQ